MKVYTKTGDEGITSLYDGTRVSKADQVFDVLGSIDELAAHIGVLMNTFIHKDSYISLKNIQETLLDIGSIIATPLNNKPLPTVCWLDIKDIEEEIDRLTLSLKPLSDFLILDGKTKESAQAHVCRVVCRRVERDMEKYGNIDRNLIIYINRLSDYFFTLARVEGEKPKSFLTNFLDFFRGLPIFNN
jgi:cob(I)alamin adenosyltransferase